MSTRPPPPLPPAPVTAACSELERLHDDCRRGYTAAVHATIGDQPALVGKAGNLGYTALHWAAATGHVDIVELLLHSGADANAVTASGDSALHLASWKRHAGAVLALLRVHAKTDIKNSDGKTAEELARTDEVRSAFDSVAASQIQVVEESFDSSDDE